MQLAQNWAMNMPIWIGNREEFRVDTSDGSSWWRCCRWCSSRKKALPVGARCTHPQKNAIALSATQTESGSRPRIRL